MQQLSVKYRTYALDLWGFGDSGKHRTYYNIDGQVELLQGFIEGMALTKAVFVGHGLGAAVLAHYATRSQSNRDKVHRMMVIAPPVYDTGTQQLTQNRSSSPISPTPSPSPPSSSSQSTSHNANTIMRPSDSDRERLQQGQNLPNNHSDPTVQRPRELTSDEMSLPSPTSPILDTMVRGSNPLADIISKTKPVDLLSRYVDTTSSDYEKLKIEVEKADEEALSKSAQSLSRANVFLNLMQLKTPTVAVYGNDDTFVTQPPSILMDKMREREQFKIITLDGVRHFPMLEDITQFTRLLREFLEVPNVMDLEVKEEWKRRNR
jgi:pimeloyl-ACP methyl ester carboxylesterase